VLSSEAVVYNKFAFKSLPFDPEKDLDPIVNLFINANALVINSKLNVKTIPELVAHAKAKPKTLSYGTFSFVLVLMFIMVGGIILADIVSSRLSVIERIGLTATSLIVVHRDWKREFAWRSITAIERLPAKNGLRLHLSSEVPVQIPSLGGPLCTELETEWARKRTSAPSAAGP